MTNNTFTSTYNVISVAFEDDCNTYAALTALKQLNTQGQLNLEAAAVVVRGDDGKLDVKDQVGDVDYAGTASGGTLGLLIGVLGGPVGVLVGGTYGLMVGSLFDLGEAEETESVLSQISTSVRPGRTALLAQITEQSPEVVDVTMSRLGGTVLRRPVDEVEAEIAVAEQAQREATREANKEQVQARVQALKAKQPHAAKTAGS
jgi:uncharacterized membrane protein